MPSSYKTYKHTWGPYLNSSPYKHYPETGSTPPPTDLPQQDNFNWHLLSENVVLSGDNVLSMVDQGALGNNTTNTGTAPTWEPATINGLPTVQANGTTVINLIHNTTQYWDPAAPYSALIVGKCLQVNPAYYVLSGITGPTGQDGSIFLFPFSGTVNFVFFTGTSNPDAIRFSATTAYLSNFTLAISYNGSGFSNLVNWDIRLNGVPASLTYEAAVSGGLSSTNYFNNGALATPSFQHAENTSWSVALTPTEMDQVSAYCLVRYGIGT